MMVVSTQSGIDNALANTAEQHSMHLFFYLMSTVVKCDACLTVSAQFIVYGLSSICAAVYLIVIHCDLALKWHCSYYVDDKS